MSHREDVFNGWQLLQSDSESYLRYLCFCEQGSKAPERSSTYWASSYSLKFVLWFNLLKRQSRKTCFITMLVAKKKEALHNKHDVILQGQSFVLVGIDQYEK